MKKSNKSTDSLWLYGKHPVLLALRLGRRKIYELVINKKHLSELQQALKENKITLPSNLIRVADNSYIASLLPKEAVHQGFALKASSLLLISEDDFISSLSKYPKDKLPPLLILDQLTDPHNVGAIIRSASAFGIANLVITSHNSASESPTLCKSSAGTIELINLILAGNLNNLLSELKEAGYWCIGLDGQSQHSITSLQNHKNLALVIGSEGNGIRPLVKKNCDLLVKIPMAQGVESLNASNAAAIALYELFADC